ncbi:MAG: aspartate aminotransferase family protein [Bacillota bacterium]
MHSKPKLKLDRSMALYEEAQRLSPGGLMGIRRPYNFVPGEYPIFIESGYGGHIIDVDGNDYIDMLCAYGPIILGYNEPEINNEVIRQMEKGFCFSLVQEVQNRLEQRLIDLIPSAEMVVPCKTGSDATSIAIRVARAYNDRKLVLRCGYHGWHDWCVENKGGVPEDIAKLTLEFEYGDLDELEEMLKEHHNDAACIIITPVGHPLNAPVMPPPEGYLQGVRELADKYDVVLIFDEIRTGFRASLGGAQKRYGVTPDISVFGKAMANGYAISACVGKAQFMKVLEKKAFVSSTFFPNSLEMVAALKCMEILERDNILDNLWERGQSFLDRLTSIVEKSGVPATVSGIPPMPFVTFDKVDEKYKERRVFFYTETIRRNLFIQPFHHWYICHRHSDADLDYALNAIEEALEVTNKIYPSVK